MMTELTARTYFAPFNDWICLVWQTGWNDYHKLIAHPEDDPRSRSVNIQNRAIIYAKSSCQGFGVKHVPFNTRNLFRFPDGPYVQFKKLSEDMLPINAINDTADAFDRQESLDGLDDIPRITAGYRPNDLHSDYSLYLVLPKSHYQYNWVIPISGQQQLISLPLSDVPTKPTRVSPVRVRTKAPGGSQLPDKSDTSATSA